MSASGCCDSGGGGCGPTASSCGPGTSASQSSAAPAVGAEYCPCDNRGEVDRYGLLRERLQHLQLRIASSQPVGVPCDAMWLKVQSDFS
jgi:hypothetical protein